MNAIGCGSVRGILKLAAVLAAILLLSLVIEQAVARGEGVGPSLAFVDASAASLAPDSTGEFKLDIPVRNAGSTDAAGSLKLLGENDNGCDKLSQTEIAKLSKGDVIVAHMQIANVILPATCYLVLRTANGDTMLKQLKLAQHYATSAVLRPLCFCFWISIAVVIVAWVATWNLGTISPWFVLGSPAWEFTKSWTSTTTLVGGVFAAALSLSALPDLTRYASKAGYSAISLLISLLVVIAPLVYVAFRHGDIEEDEAKQTYSVSYRGCVWAFLLSSAATVFAGLAQLVMLSLLLREVFRGSRLESLSVAHDPWQFDSWSSATFGLGAISCWYAGYSIFLTIKLQYLANGAPPVSKEAQDQGGPDRLAPPRRAETAKRQFLTWPVL